MEGGWGQLSSAQLPTNCCPVDFAWRHSRYNIAAARIEVGCVPPRHRVELLQGEIDRSRPDSLRCCRRGRLAIAACVEPVHCGPLYVEHLCSINRDSKSDSRLQKGQITDVLLTLTASEFDTCVESMVQATVRVSLVPEAFTAENLTVANPALKTGVRVKRLPEVESCARVPRARFIAHNTWDVLSKLAIAQN